MFNKSDTHISSIFAQMLSHAMKWMFQVQYKFSSFNNMLLLKSFYLIPQFVKQVQKSYLLCMNIQW